MYVAVLYIVSFIESIFCKTLYCSLYWLLYIYKFEQYIRPIYQNNKPYKHIFIYTLLIRSYTLDITLLYYTMKPTATQTTIPANTNTNTKTLDQLMRRLEEKGMQQSAGLMNTAMSSTLLQQTTGHSGKPMANPLETGITEVVKNIPQNSILDIMKEGEAEFVKQTGRYMTYGEMRQMYG